MSASSAEAWSGLRASSNGSSVSIDTTFSRNASNRGWIGEDFAVRNSSGFPGEYLPNVCRTSGHLFDRQRTSCPHGGRRFPSRLPGRGRLGIASGRRTHRSEGWRRSPIRSDAFGPSGVKKSWAAADPGRHPGAPPVPGRVQPVRARPGGPHGGRASPPNLALGKISKSTRC